MDALLLLTADHNRVRGLFARFEAAEEGGDTAGMTTLAAKILEELEVHTAIEEQIFYPGVSQVDDEIHDVVVEGLEEHHVVKQLAEEVQMLSPDDEHWAAKLKVLIENVEHHAEEEEQELFPDVKKAVSADVLEDLGAQMEALKAQLGAPTAADKESLTTEELQTLAKEQEIPGRSSMKREELVATVAPE